MKYLGIDYGLKKVGLAISDGVLADPLKVIRYEDQSELMTHIVKVVEEEKVEKVIIGVSEGEMGEKTKGFSLNLRKTINIPVENYDETLSTWEAQKLSIEGGIGRKKRRQLEDAYAASLVLQSFLDNQKNV